ncbi:PhzF family phenazine biosynthesis protein [Bradyrhizobium sp. Ec3.3]|uniref:PhzF family phenazine biosynthesis protein n=1 Tax=Bradyrhizobium sp. Ec3.3 TaxID=189753 RepID=UPI0003F5C6D2|nr:PhzF family phenazine biosynthesis protein [Bradyrhizobium sp. Ec3.3]
MDVQRLAAFTRDDQGGNPAGVVICDVLPEADDMQRLAAEVGYSETVFAAPTAKGYRVRYFAPEAEVPFCGHATIALGAALAQRGESGPITLELNGGTAIVEGFRTARGLSAALQSAPTRNQPAPPELLDRSLDLFALSQADLDDRFPPAIIEAGARHLLLAIRDRQRLAAMKYDLPAGAKLMRDWRLTTISLIQAESPSRYHARNPFAAGGVYEDPATGAAAAALVAYLRDLGIAGADNIEVVQGDDMGIPCLLHADAPTEAGGSARVHGTVRVLAG